MWSNIAFIKRRKCTQILFGIPAAKRPLARYTRRRVDDTENQRCTEMTLGEGPVVFWWEHGDEPSGSAKIWEFIKRRAAWRLKKDCAAWRPNYTYKLPNASWHLSRREECIMPPCLTCWYRLANQPPKKLCVCFCEVVTYLQRPLLRRVITSGFFSIVSPFGILLHIIIISSCSTQVCLNLLCLPCCVVLLCLFADVSVLFVYSCCVCNWLLRC